MDNFLTLNPAFWTPGPMELIIILIIAVLIFGRKLPEIARGMGKSLVEFKKGINEAKNIKDDVEKDVKEASGIDDIKINENMDQ